MKYIKSVLLILKYTVYFPLLIPAILSFCFGICDKKNLKLDLKVNYERHYLKPIKSYLVALYRLMVDKSTFRNIFYYRSKPFSALYKFLCKENPSLYIYVDSLGGGIYIQHGFSTILNARAIGRNFFVNQNVTVGWRNDAGNPVIGDNVRIGTGAVVLGNINIGDNVSIGAGATVIKDVPSGSTVVPPPSIICRINGEKTLITL